jgi:hypothetical protein
MVKLRLLASLTLALFMTSVCSTSAQVQSRVLHINHAVYGKQGRGEDVTNRLRALVRNNTVDVKVNNENMGGDPNEHVKKTLKVDYTYMGRRMSKVVNEGDQLRLP